MIAKSALILLSLCGISLAGGGPAKAKADFLCTSSTYQDAPVQAAIRLRVDLGWHTYWSNPGEGGMKLAVKWDLPDGWQAEEIEEPVPKRFMTGELAGFGYDGTVIFPVHFRPAPDATGPVKLKGRLSWLTCNDASCIPGTADLEISLEKGPATPTNDASVIDQALQRIPRIENATFDLAVKEQPTALQLSLRPRPGNTLNPADCDFFPATPRVIDPKAKFEFHKADGSWTAMLAKNEYAAPKIGELTLVLVPPDAGKPQALVWKMANDAADKK